MLCEECLGYMDAYLAEGLVPDLKGRVETHLRGCPDCSAEYRRSGDLLSETGSAFKWALPASDIEGRVMQQVAGTSMRLDKSWGDVMREQWERAPWWMISAAVHAVILMLMTVITVATASKKRDDIVITTDLAKKKEPEYDEKKVRDIFRNTKEVEAEEIVENPVFVHEEVEITDHFETENDMDTNTARGQEDAISDIPLGGTGVVGNIGVGGGGAGCFGYRTGGGRRRAVARFGGSKASESAVNAALRWLARHQEPDGHWDTVKYQAVSKADSGISGLAVLAFLGAGHTEKAGEYRMNVRKGLQWLMEVQKQNTNGVICDKGDLRPGYEHPIAAMALAEAYGMARNPKVGQAAQKAIDYSIGVHQVEYSGWRYGPKDPGDTSVTGWFIMQLKSARVTGLKVDGRGFAGAAAFLDSVEDKGEYKGYKGARFKYMPARGNVTPCMTAVGMLGRLFMGVKPPDLRGGGEYLLERLPKWNAGEDLGFYYWYYGTLVMFQMGGEYWKQWNPMMRDMLLQNQRRGGDEDGSWDPLSRHGDYKCRVMTTALGALCLEVYYRYLPMYSK